MQEGVQFDPTVNVEFTGGGTLAVSWTTENETTNTQVQWAKSLSDLNLRNSTFRVARDERVSSGDYVNRRVHRIPVQSTSGVAVSHGDTIYFNIVTDDIRHPAGPFEATIPNGALISPGDFLLGEVEHPGGAAADQCLVMTRFTQTSTISGSPVEYHSMWSSNLTDGGFYSIDATNLRQDPRNPSPNNNYNNAFQYSDDAIITTIVRCSMDSETMVSATAGDIKIDAGYRNAVIVVPQP